MHMLKIQEPLHPSCSANLLQVDNRIKVASKQLVYSTASLKSQHIKLFQGSKCCNAHTRMED